MLPTQVMSELGCHFVHRRLIGAARGAFTGGIPGAIGGFVEGGRQDRSPVLTRTPAVTAPGGPGSPTSTAISGSCPHGHVRDARGRCRKTGIEGAVERLLPGGDTGFAPDDMFGAAVMGRYGAALEPAHIPSERLRCPSGTVLGRDDLCYNRRDLKKSERKWPPGTKPVLTGGQVNTLRKAQRIQERMKKLGLTGAPHTHRRKTKKLLSR